MLHVAEPQSSGTYQGTRSRPVNQSRMLMVIIPLWSMIDSNHRHGASA